MAKESVDTNESEGNEGYEYYEGFEGHIDWKAKGLNKNHGTGHQEL